MMENASREIMGEIIDHWQVPPIPNGIILDESDVCVRPLNVGLHAEPLFEAYAKDSAHKGWNYMPYGPFDRLDIFQKWLTESCLQTDPCFFVIEDKHKRQVLGMASFLRIKPDIGVIEVGHIHFSPSLQKSTLASKAMYLMMQWVFENGYRRYEWKCNALNVPSRKAAQRLGFSFEGIFRQATISKGRNRDTAWFAVIDQEWPALKECFHAWFDDRNFVEGQQQQSLSELTRPLLYKVDPEIHS